MSVDDETRKVIHDLRNALHELQLTNTRSTADCEKSLLVMQAELKSLNEKLHQMVTRPEFTPVKLLVYGLTATVMSGAIGAILSKILIK